MIDTLKDFVVLIGMSSTNFKFLGNQIYILKAANNKCQGILTITSLARNSSFFLILLGFTHAIQLASHVT